MQGFLKQAAVGCAALTLAAVAGATTIIQTDFVSNGDNVSLPGTTVGITTNLPGGNWVTGGGYSWSSPQTFATWMGGTLQDVATLNQEKTALGLTMGSYNTGTLTVSADIYFGDTNAPNAAGGVGFWSAIPPKSTDPVDQVGVTNFSGFMISRPTGNLQLYVAGSAVGAAVPVAAGPLSLSTNISGVQTLIPYTIKYDVDTASGDISNVTFNGTPIADFTTTGFTSAATANVGIVSDFGSNGITFDNLNVSSAVPEPATLGLVALSGLALLRRRRTQA